jgi:hypothetical protein
MRGSRRARRWFVGAIAASVAVALPAAPRAVSSAPADASADLAATVRTIENACFAAYPQELLTRMSGKLGPPPEAVRLDPRLQMKYLMTEEKAQKGLFYPSLLEDLLPAFVAEVKPGRRFLDLGSGDGRVVFLAAVLGAQAKGVEFDGAVHAIALDARKRLHELVPEKRADLRRGDFYREDPKQFDVLFYFGSGTYAEADLMRWLARGMRRDAVLLLAHVTNDPDGFEPISEYGVVRSYRPLQD